MKRIKLNRIYFLTLIVIIIFSCNNKKSNDDYVFVPEIDGEWWQVAGNPDLGEFTTDRQEPVDFGVWQAEDGTWQLWSCIRHTDCGEHTRLFYGWEGQNLTDSNWKPMGIKMEGDTTLGEASGGLQAPHVIIKDDIYYMLYGGWAQICIAKSEDGKTFERIINEDGKTEIFSGPYINTRDAMTLKIDDKYYCYYTGHLLDAEQDEIEAAIFCRTSEDLFNWSEATMVSAGGSVKDLDGWGGGDAECPFVVAMEDRYILFRNQIYGPNSLNTQYVSEDPMDFGVGTDKYMVGQLEVAAPEIIKVGDQYYIASLNLKLDGIRIAKLKFKKVKKNELEINNNSK